MNKWKEKKEGAKMHTTKNAKRGFGESCRLTRDKRLRELLKKLNGDNDLESENLAIYLRQIEISLRGFSECNN